MEKGYFISTVVQLAELVHLFKSWGMNQGDAIRLAISLTFPRAAGDNDVRALVDSFRPSSVREGACGADVVVTGGDVDQRTLSGIDGTMTGRSIVTVTVGETTPQEMDMAMLKAGHPRTDPIPEGPDGKRMTMPIVQTY